MNILSEEKRFYILNENGSEIAEITYTYAGEEIIIIDHTYVDDAYRGNRYAEELVKRVVEKAKIEGIKIIPLCPFAASEFRRKAEYREVQKSKISYFFMY